MWADRLVTETNEQVERYNEMSYAERSWRADRGLLSLAGYARWKAGYIVLRSMLLTIGLILIIAFLIASLVSIPLVFLFDFNPSMSISVESDSDLVFIALVAGLFVLMGPSAALTSLSGIREELEQLTRDEGTFWAEKYSSDSRPS